MMLMLKSTINTLKAMDNNKIRKLIFTSSVAVYGDNVNNASEEYEINPSNHYGKSKYEAEKIIYKWYNNDKKNKSVTILRPTVVFGENNRGNVYNLFNQISKNKFIMIGNGNNKKSIAYVENISAFIKYLMFNKKNELNIYNYSDYPDLSMNELVKLISSNLKVKVISFKLPYIIGILIGYIFDFLSFIFSRKFKISSIRIKKFVSTSLINSEKAFKVFNPPFSIKESIKKVLYFEFINK